MNIDAANIDITIIPNVRPRIISGRVKFSFDKMDNKTVCHNCRYCSDDDIERCLLVKEAHIDYVTGEFFTGYARCYEKNINGNCQDYIPEDLEVRLDVIIEAGRKQLQQELDDIIQPIKNKYLNSSYKEFVKNMTEKIANTFHIQPTLITPNNPWPRE